MCVQNQLRISESTISTRLSIILNCCKKSGNKTFSPNFTI